MNHVSMLLIALAVPPIVPSSRTADDLTGHAGYSVIYDQIASTTDEIGELTSQVKKLEASLAAERSKLEAAEKKIGELGAMLKYSIALPADWHEGSVVKVDSDHSTVSWSTRRGIVTTDSMYAYSFYDGQKVMLKVTASRLLAIKLSSWPPIGLEETINQAVENEAKRFFVH